MFTLRKIAATGAAGIAAAVLVLSGLSKGYAMDGLSDYRWKNRVIVVFADEGDDARQQLLLLQRQADELDQRQIVVLTVAGDDVRVEHGDRRGPAPDAQDLRATLGAAGSRFRIVLLGKDGGVKLNQATLTPPEEIFALIDTMPMRKQEMQSGNQGRETIFRGSLSSMTSEVIDA